MYCMKCGTPAGQGARFCMGCGELMIRPAPAMPGMTAEAAERAPVWVFEPFRKYAVFAGRARRKEYWMFTLLTFVAGLVCAIIDAILDPASVDRGFGAASVLLMLAIFVPAIAVSVRRLHDIDRSGWWLLVALIPFAGVIVLFVFAVLEGTSGENAYGPDPKSSVPTARVAQKGAGLIAAVIAITPIFTTPVAGQSSMTVREFAGLHADHQAKVLRDNLDNLSPRTPRLEALAIRALFLPDAGDKPVGLEAITPWIDRYSITNPDIGILEIVIRFVDSFVSDVRQPWMGESSDEKVLSTFAFLCSTRIADDKLTVLQAETKSAQTIINVKIGLMDRFDRPTYERHLRRWQTVERALEGYIGGAVQGTMISYRFQRASLDTEADRARSRCREEAARQTIANLDPEVLAKTLMKADDGSTALTRAWMSSVVLPFFRSEFSKNAALCPAS